MRIEIPNACARRAGRAATLAVAALLGSCSDIPDLMPHVRSALGLGNGERTVNGTTVSSSSHASPFLSAENLFAKDATSPWISRRMPFFPEWVEFTYPERRSMGEFGYNSLPGRPGSAPKEFVVEVWQNGRWRPAVSVADGCVTPTKMRRSWNLAEEVKGRRFRMVIKSNCGDNEHVALQRIYVEPYRQLARLGAMKPDAYGRLFPGKMRPGAISASSELNATAKARNLFDGNPNSVWHREIANLQKDKISWIEIDLGAAPEAPVDALTIGPHPGQPGQFFDVAYFQGSQDGRQWAEIAQLKLADAPKDGTGISWTFDNATAYRHYRLMIPSGFTGGIFYSMSEMALLASGVASRAQPPALPAAKLTAPRSTAKDRLFPRRRGHGKVAASSFLDEGTRIEKLFDGNRRTVWHVDVAKASKGDVPWVRMDLGAETRRPVRIIRAWPNAAAVDQFIAQAVLEGGMDGKDWAAVTRLAFFAKPIDGSEVAWQFDNRKPYRYYRLRIPKGHAGGSFLSMAELEMYAWPVKPAVARR